MRQVPNNRRAFLSQRVRVGDKFTEMCRYLARVFKKAVRAVVCVFLVLCPGHGLQISFSNYKEVRDNISNMLVELYQWCYTKSLWGTQHSNSAFYRFNLELYLKSWKLNAKIEHLAWGGSNIVTALKLTPKRKCFSC